ncbi:MAG: HNH endonuclease [Sarcina sp.]
MRLNTNTYVKHDEVTEIHTKKGEVILVDNDDFKIVSKYCWYISTKGYVYSRKNKQHIAMHRILMSPGILQVDHINRNKSDNRKCNLRLLTNQQNQYNTKVPVNNKSGIKGIYYNKTCDKWCAQVTINGKTKSLGLFENKEEAILVRNRAENLYYKF